MCNFKDQTRDTTLDMLRGVAILIVVFGHAIQANLLAGGVLRSYGVK